MLGHKAMDQVTEEELFFQPNSASNSIAQIVKHLHGNMRSRWTDFLTTDGEKPWRNREDEFVVNFTERTQLMDLWDEGWKCLYGALDDLSIDNFDQTIYIRNQGHSITEAIHRQLSHYSYHIGQIVYMARMIKGDQWQSLSIPKGTSEAYNSEKFAQNKKRKHFIDEYLK